MHPDLIAHLQNMYSMKYISKNTIFSVYMFQEAMAHNKYIRISFILVYV